LRFAGCLAGFFVPVCVAGAVLCLWVSALWSALMRCAVVLGCAFINKNKGLQHFLNETDYMRDNIPINFLIISIMCPPLFDYIDYIMSIISVFFCVKKTPPSKSFGSLFFSQG